MRALRTLSTTLVLSVILLVSTAKVVLTDQAKLQPLLLAQAHSPTQLVTPKAAIERLFTAEKIQASWFASTFLSQVPVSQVEQIIANLRMELGAYQGVQEESNDYSIVFERGSISAQIILDDSGQIMGLRFTPRAKFTNLNEAIEQFKGLPGKVSFLVLEGDAERAALNSTTPLAVGSAFKLAVLDALKTQIAQGKRSWSDVIELQPSWKSLPSGILQTWPDRSLLTVQTLAALMISQSDNTATDSLIHLVGREAIEAVTPRNRPFLTTREFFLLKSAKNEELLKRYRAGDDVQRRTVLKELNQLPPPEINAIGSTPKALDVEWFFTAQELCSLVKNVADLPLMSIKPGIANAKDWERVAFKGGSEAGVLNLTTWLTAKNGKRYCVTATWNNDAALEESHFMALYGGVLEILK